MGGLGSGFQGTAKATTDDRLRLDIKALAKAGALEPGARATVQATRGSLATEALPGALVLVYRLNGAPRRDVIDLERAPCRFGGSRPWFLCPWCGRRCAGLYASTGGFCCRQCATLNYPATREDPRYRHMRRADKLRARLGWGPGIANPRGGRPKGMHWRTYARLATEYNRHEAAHWNLWGAMLNARQARLQGARGKG